MVRVLALAAAAAASVVLGAPHLIDHRFRITDNLHKFEDPTTEAVTADPAENWFDQKLDHNNANNKATWKQRYFYSDQFYGGKGYPVFLYIEGESAASPRTVTSSGLFMNELAKKHKALVVALEHRFYGKSQPFPTLATEGLQYLRAEQALADLVNFQDFFKAKQNLTDNKWVAFGGSYPGMLAGWLKLKYPGRFAGTVASSAPINTKVDFFEYGDIVSEGLRFFGGDSCVDTIKDATTELHRLVASSKADDAATLKKLFNPCYDFKNDYDRGTFEQQVFGAFQGIAQYNDFDATGSTGLTNVCKKFAEPGLTPIEKLSKFIGNTGGENCTYNKWEGYVEYYQDTTIGEDSWSRPWFYQTCAEFGFAQITNTGHGAFAPLQYNTAETLQYSLCKAVFNITDNDARAAATIKKYGGLKVDVANVVWPTGTIDPWAGLALSNSTGAVNSGSVVVDIIGTSHCRDMYSRKPNDIGALVWAHQKIEAEVDGYLRSKC